jgi:hypothetical protein
MLEGIGTSFLEELDASKVESPDIYIARIYILFVACGEDRSQEKSCIEQRQRK